MAHIDTLRVSGYVYGLQGFEGVQGVAFFGLRAYGSELRV